MLAIFVFSLIFAPSCDASELPAAKPLTASQEALWDEQEDLFEKVQSSSPDQYANLIERLQSLLNKQLKAFGPDSPQVSCTLDQLWSLYRAEKKPVQEIETAQKSLTIKRAILGPQAVDTAMTTCHLASSLAANKQYEAALTLLQNYLKQLDPTDTRSAETMTTYEIAQTYYQWNKFAEAQPWFDKAVNLKARYAQRSRVYPSYRKAVLSQRANQRLAQRSRLQ